MHLVNTALYNVVGDIIGSSKFIYFKSTVYMYMYYIVWPARPIQFLFSLFMLREDYMPQHIKVRGGMGLAGQTSIYSAYEMAGDDENIIDAIHDIK